MSEEPVVESQDAAEGDQEGGVAGLEQGPAEEEHDEQGGGGHEGVKKKPGEGDEGCARDAEQFAGPDPGRLQEFADQQSVDHGGGMQSDVQCGHEGRGPVEMPGDDECAGVSLPAFEFHRQSVDRHEGRFSAGEEAGGEECSDDACQQEQLHGRFVRCGGARFRGYPTGTGR